MTSWLPKSFSTSSQLSPPPPPPPPPPPHHSTTQGVKDDLSELTQTLTRQFLGVANFLAPPPPDPITTTQDESSPESAEDPAISGRIRSDLGEIKGQVASGISNFATNLFGSEEEEEEDEEVIGLTEEVLNFASNIARHPETWLDFPLLPDDDDEDSDELFSYFDMSDAQQEHAFAIEQLAPRLAALRIELCPIHMNEECFWKIYFVLLHPRLNKQDAELLSTPQIVEARAMLLQRLQNTMKLEKEARIASLQYRKANDVVTHPEEILAASKYPSESSTPRIQEATSVPAADPETEKYTNQASPMVDKSVIEVDQPLHPHQNHNDASKFSVIGFEEDEDDVWFAEEAEVAGGVNIAIGDQEDVSFSDLEEDDGK